MEASIMDLISSLFKRNDSGGVVPIDPLTYNIQHQPISYANEDIIPGLHASQDEALGLIEKYRNPEDEAIAGQYGTMGAESNAEPKVYTGEYADLDPYMRAMLERQDKTIPIVRRPKQYPPTYRPEEE